MVDYMQRLQSTIDLKQKSRQSLMPEFNLDWVQNRLGLLRWLVPLLLLVFVVIVEFGPSQWIYNRYGFGYHLAAEIFLFAVIGPALAFGVLNMAQRWMDERDTSDWQARLLAHARKDARKSRQLNDDALQVLFATGTLFKLLKADGPELTPTNRDQIEAAEVALDKAVKRIREHLQKVDPPGSR